MPKFGQINLNQKTMRSIFLNIKSDAAGYVSGKLMAQMNYVPGGYELTPGTAEAFLQNALSQTQKPAPRIASSEEFYKTDKQQLLQVQIAERCALQELVELAPLLPGEEITGDFFSYLLEPVDDIPANTGVLKRTTNMAEILYIFEYVQIDNGTLVHIAPPPAAVPPGPRRLLRGGPAAAFSTKDIIKKLLKTAGTKIGSAVLSKVGSIVLSLVMKELGIENDNDKLLAEIKKTIKEEIDGNEISKIEGRIEGTIQFMTVEYKNQKAKLDLSKIENRRVLMSDLKTYSNLFYVDVIGTLKQERYAVRGLKTFMFAAPVHALLTQEMALVDPDFMDPNQSSFLQTLRENATIYRNHVQRSYDKAMGDRNRMEVFSRIFVDSMGNSTVSKTTWWWRDNVTNKEAGEFGSSKNPDKSGYQNAADSLERYRNDVLNKRREELGKPQETFLDVIGDLQNFSFPKA
jgi:hypothetical protein